jgi:hypothetical protein
LVTSPNNGVVVMADVLAYDEFVRLPGTAVKYAGEETMNCAMSLAS